MSMKSAASVNKQKTDPGFRSFEVEAEEVMSRSKTRRAQRIVQAAVLIVAGLIFWASIAKVDEVTRGDAKVVPS